jgi:hypothetical protein
MQPTINRYTTLFGHVTFGVLAILALVFWRERTIFLDAAFQSFYVINRESLFIVVDRFGAAFVQSFPLLTTKLGFPLSGILMSYSFAFVAFHWLAFFICDKILKVKALALCILLWYVLMTAHTFYWAQNEVIQGISLTFVYFALLMRRGEFSKMRWWDYPLSIGLVFTVVYFHPLIIFPFCFLWGYFFIDRKNEFPKLSLGLLAWSFIGFAAANITKFYVTGVSPYDKGSSERLSDNIVRPIGELLRGPSQRLFWGHCFDDFVLVLPFLIVIVGFYIWQKAFLKLLFFLASTFGFIFVIATSYYESKDWFYLESQYLPLAVMLAVPFVFDVMPNIKKAKWAVGILGFVLIFKVLYIFQTHQPYTNRLAYLTQLMDKTRTTGSTKLFTNDDNIDEKTLLMSWGCAYETLYLSAIQSPDSTRSLHIVGEPKEKMWMTEGKKNFYTAFDNLEYGKANRRYFNFQDTSKGYFLLEKKDFEK